MFGGLKINEGNTSFLDNYDSNLNFFCLGRGAPRPKLIKSLISALVICHVHGEGLASVTSTR